MQPPENPADAGLVSVGRRFASVVGRARGRLSRDNRAVRGYCPREVDPGRPRAGESCGVSHSLVVHELWVLVVVGSNPSTPSVLIVEAREQARCP